MSPMSICSIDFDKSSTENGMLQHNRILEGKYRPNAKVIGKTDWMNAKQSLKTWCKWDQYHKGDFTS